MHMCHAAPRSGAGGHARELPRRRRSEVCGKFIGPPPFAHVAWPRPGLGLSTVRCRRSPLHESAHYATCAANPASTTLEGRPSRSGARLAMIDTWPGLLKVLLDSPRVWAVSFALALLGITTFLARRYGFVDDLPPTYYYAAVGLGLGSALLIGTMAAQNGVAYVAAKWAARQRKKLRDAFARRNFLTASRAERAILLYYKGINIQRFRVRAGALLGETFVDMTRQALLDSDSLGGGAAVTHFQIPDVVWTLLDEPPPGWAQGVRELADAPWERDRERI